jgi:hypothetical protein
MPNSRLACVLSAVRYPGRSVGTAIGSQRMELATIRRKPIRALAESLNPGSFETGKTKRGPPQPELSICGIIANREEG